MTLHGVPKPAWRAFQLLHDHAGEYSLPAEVHNTAKCFNGSDVTLPLVSAAVTTNQTAGTGRIFLSHWDASAPEEQTMTHNNITVTITLENCQLSSQTAEAWSLDKRNEAFLLWAKMGSPNVPSSDQLKQLTAFSKTIVDGIQWKAAGSKATATVDMCPNSAKVIKIPCV